MYDLFILALLLCAHAAKDVFEYLEDPPTSNVTPCLRYLSVPFKDRYTPGVVKLF